MIIQIRGTSGSGKSTAMRKIMDLMGSWRGVYEAGRKKPILYHCVEPGWKESKPVVLGHYESPCGGCDTIGSASAVYEQIIDVIEGNGDVPILSEGLLLSEDVKWTTKLKEDGYDVRCFFLITPVERCLSQIKKRRAEAGNEKPLNEYNTTNRVGTIERARLRLIENGVNCRRCSADQVVTLVLDLLRLHAKGDDNGSGR